MNFQLSKKKKNQCSFYSEFIQWHHSYQGRQLTFWVMLRQYTPLITESAIAICIFLFPFTICKDKKTRAFFPFILSLVLISTDSECYFNLFYVQTNTYIVNVIMVFLWKCCIFWFLAQYWQMDAKNMSIELAGLPITRILLTQRTVRLGLWINLLVLLL